MYDARQGPCMSKKDLNFRTIVQRFFYNVFQLPKGTPPTPVQASQARWVGVPVHIVLLGIVG
jgi:hypothetical protein